MSYMTSHKKNRALLLSILFVLILLIGSVAFILFSRSQSSSACIAYVYQDGNLIDTIDLNQVNESYTFKVTGENGAENTVEVRHGEIGIIEATCPDHVCIDTGFIHNSTMPVVCLPNKLIIEIKTASSSSGDLDGYAY